MSKQWKYLEQPPSSWRKQLYLKGRRLKAFDVWRTMQVESESPEEAAENWDLPMAVIAEIIEYCSANEDVFTRDAEIERKSLEASGYIIEPKTPHR